MSVDGVKHRHCVASKQAGPLHGVHHPLHRASHEGHKHRGVVGQQHQAPPQLSAMVDNQIDPLIMACHLYKAQLKVLRTSAFAQVIIFRFLKNVYADTSLKGVDVFKLADAPLHAQIATVQSETRKFGFRECLVMWLCSDIHPRKYIK